MSLYMENYCHSIPTMPLKMADITSPCNISHGYCHGDKLFDNVLSVLGTASRLRAISSFSFSLKLIITALE